MVLEYHRKGNLYLYMHNRQRLPNHEIKKFFTQACLAVKYLHSQGILMRDLKPENFLLTENNDLKMCDFGWASYDYDIDYSMVRAGTLPYMSPECLLEKKQSYKSDVWSLGVFLYELVFLREPYLALNVKAQLEEIQNKTIDFS